MRFESKSRENGGNHVILESGQVYAALTIERDRVWSFPLRKIRLYVRRHGARKALDLLTRESMEAERVGAPDLPSFEECKFCPNYYRDVPGWLARL